MEPQEIDEDDKYIPNPCDICEKFKFRNMRRQDREVFLIKDCEIVCEPSNLVSDSVKKSITMWKNTYQQELQQYHYNNECEICINFKKEKIKEKEFQKYAIIENHTIKNITVTDDSPYDMHLLNFMIMLLRNELESLHPHKKSL